MAEEKMNVLDNSMPSPVSYKKLKFKDKLVTLKERDQDRIIEMAWEDRTPFEAITLQFGLKEDEVKTLMRKVLKFSSYKRWRKRVEHSSTKHLKTRTEEIGRFKSKAQKVITGNKISKKEY